MKNKFILFVKFISILTICQFYLTSCIGGSKIEDMLSPPKLSAEQAEINSALVSSRGQGFRLKYPKSGDYLSAFLNVDIDGDNQQEAMVFYEMTGIGSERIIWMNFLDKNDKGSWQSVYELPIRGTDIEKVYFTPLGDGDFVNIIVCYSISQGEKSFMVIKYSNKTPALIYEDAYCFLDVGDYFDEGIKNLLVIKNDRNLNTVGATVYVWKGENFSYYKEVPLDPTAGEYIGATYGKVDKNTNAIIIEHKKNGDGEQYGTDLLYKSGNRLLNAVYSKGMELNSEGTTRRGNLYTEYAAPTDINGDGFIELCGSDEFPGYEGRENSEKLYMITWKAFEYGALKELFATYYTAKNGYYFIIPNRWRNEVEATLSENNTRITFKSPGGAELLSIKTVFESESFTDDGFLFLMKNDELKNGYYIRLNNEDYLAITDREFGAYFSKLGDS